MKYEIELLLTDDTPAQGVQNLDATFESLENTLSRFGDHLAQTLEIRASAERVMYVTGGDDGLFMLGVGQQDVWLNASSNDPAEGFVSLVAGGQRADYPRASCLPLKIALEVARAFMASDGEILSSACSWDDPPAASPSRQRAAAD